MALGLTVLSIIAASFALGVNFAEIRAELYLRSAARIREGHCARLQIRQTLSTKPANANQPGYRPAA